MEHWVAEQEIVPAHAPGSLHCTEHWEPAHEMSPHSLPLPPQITLQLLAPEQSTVLQELGSWQSTWHGMPAGQVTSAPQGAVGEQKKLQTPSTHWPPWQSDSQSASDSAASLASTPARASGVIASAVVESGAVEASVAPSPLGPISASSPGLCASAPGARPPFDTLHAAVATTSNASANRNIPNHTNTPTTGATPPRTGPSGPSAHFIVNAP
jgi:hypothetical protein